MEALVILLGQRRKKERENKKDYKTLATFHHPFKLAYTSKSLTMYYNLSIYLYDY